MTTATTTRKQVIDTLRRYLQHASVPTPLEAAALTTALTAPSVRDAALATLLGHDHIAYRLASGDRDIPLDWVDQRIPHTRATRAITVLEALAAGVTHAHYLEPVRCLQAHLMWCSGRPLAAHTYLAAPACTSSYASWLRSLIQQGIDPA